MTRSLNQQRYKILGGPGCGKTTEILQTIKKFFKEGIPPEQLLMVGFAKATVDNLKKRCIDELNFSSEESESIKTIHKYCKDKLPVDAQCVFSSSAKKEFKNKIKTDPKNWTMLDDANYTATTSEADMALWNEQEDKKIGTIFALIGHARHEMKKSIEEVLNFSDTTRHFQYLRLLRSEIRYTYSNYIKFKEQNRVIDFEDMLEKALKPDIEFPSYEVVMVDEAQDLSKLEWKVISKLGIKTKKLFLVGDDDQAIFGWKGSNPKIFRTWPCSKENKKFLEKTYRLPKKVYDLAQKIITQIPIKNRLGNKYNCDKEDGIVSSISLLDELNSIINPDSEAFFMARTTVKCRDFAIYLKERGIIWKEKNKNVINIGPFQSSFPKAVGEVIKSWDMLQKGMGIHGTYLAKLAEELKPGLIKHGMKQVLTDRNLWPNEFTDKNITYTFKEIQEKFKVLADIKKEWNEVFYFTTKRKKTRRQPKALYEDDDDFNNYLKDAWNNDNTLEKANIYISTIHGLKGMESDNVILSNDWGIACLRNYNSGLSSEEEEEIRCCYVGITRTKKALHIYDPILQGKTNTFPLIGPTYGYI
mgnify:FL=1